MAFNKNSIILLDSICTFKASLQPVLSRNTQFVSCLSKFHWATAFLKPPVKLWCWKCSEEPWHLRQPVLLDHHPSSVSSCMESNLMMLSAPACVKCVGLPNIVLMISYHCIDDFLSSAAILKLGSSVQKHLGLKELNYFRRPAGISRTDSVLCRMAVGVPPRCITSPIYYFKVFPLCCLQSAGAPHR